MLQYLHINNWFDISQSLRLASIVVIFPEWWNYFHFLPFSSFFIFFLSSYSLPLFTIIQITLYIQPSYHTLFSWVCVCTFVSLYFHPSTHSLNLFLFPSVSVSVLLLSSTILYFFASECTHDLRSLYVLCSYVCVLPITSITLNVSSNFSPLPPNTHKHRSLVPEVD